MAIVIIKRKQQFVYKALALSIYINDKFVGTIKCGREAKFDVPGPINEIKIGLALNNAVRIKTNVEDSINIDVSIHSMKGKIQVNTCTEHTLEYTNEIFNTGQDTNLKCINSTFKKNFWIGFLLIIMIIALCTCLILILRYLNIIEPQGGAAIGGLAGALSTFIILSVLGKSIKGKLYISDQSIIHSSHESKVRIPLEDIISIRLSKLKIEIKGSKAVIIYPNSSKVRRALNIMIKQHNLIVFMAKVNEIETNKSIPRI